MTLKINFKAIIHYILIYVLLCFTGSMAFREYTNYFTIGTIIIGLFFILINSYKIAKDYVFFLFGILFLLVFQIFLTNYGIHISSIGSILSRFMIVMICFYYDRKYFAERLIKLIVLLSTISLIGYVIVLTYPEMLKSILSSKVELVNTYWGSYNITYYGKLLFTFQEGLGKNIGIYHEPGLYQIVLNSGLYCILFKNYLLNLNRKQEIMYTVIIIITILTCQSTTGLIGMMILLVIYLFSRRNDYSSKVVKRFVILVTIVTGVIFVFQGSNSTIYKNIIGKVINSHGKIDLSISTGHSRIVSALADIEIIKHYPFGIGYKNYNTVWKNNLMDITISDVSSCVGITQLPAILGIHIAIYILGFYSILCKKNNDKVTRIAYWLLFINIVSAQPQIWYPSIVVLLLLPRYKTENKYFTQNV